MKRSLPELQMMNYLTKIKAACTAAVTDIITSAAHGLSNNDCVQFTTTTTLPAGLALLTNYYVTVINANTFYVSATVGGDNVDITDTGTGTHSFNLQGKVIECEDHKHLVISINTANSANLTMKFQGTIQSNVNFNVAQSATNRWNYVQAIDLNSGTAIGGDTGIALTGTDDNRLLEINTNGLKAICLEVPTWTAGTINAYVKKFANDNV